MADTPRNSRFVWCALGVAAVILALALWRVRPPQPMPRDAPLGQFSAERASDALADLLGDGAPHPVGSAENDRVRARLVARLEALGLKPEVHRSVACGGRGTCAEVHNVIARLEGRRSDEVVLASHYDSVGAGAGAADDGAGVAASLEVARALTQGERPLCGVVFLFTDGEEAGLLGARAFVSDPAQRREARVVVNLEARGTSGPSLLFELSEPNAALVSALAPVLPRPLTSSLFFTVYRRLPNDTDLTIFKRGGLAGAGFAFVGDVAHYHTPLDALENLDRRSLQHHGEAGLASVKALAQAPDDLHARGNAVYFDVLGIGVVRFPGRIAPLLGVAGFLLFVATLLLWRKAGRVHARSVLRASARVPFALVASVIIAGLLGWGLQRAGALPTAFVAHPWGLRFALVALATAAVTIPLETSGPAAEGLAVLGWWSIAALALSFLLPDACFLLLVPTLVAGTLGCALHRWRLGEHATVLALIAAHGLLWLPLALLLEPSLGFTMPPMTAGVLCLLLLPLAVPLQALAVRTRRRVCAGAAALALVLGAAAFVLPPFSPTSPQRMSIALHVDADAQSSRWLVDASGGPITDDFRARFGLGDELAVTDPWFGGWGPEALSAPGPLVPLDGPEFEVVTLEHVVGAVRLHARLRSRRGARALSIHFPRDVSVHATHLAGRDVTPWPTATGTRLTYLGDTNGGVELRATLSRGDVVLTVADHSAGFPPNVAMPAARPQRAVPSQHGDVTVVSRTVPLRAP